MKVAFIYFFEGKRDIPEGYASCFSGRSHLQKKTQAGPHGKSGLFVGLGSEGDLCASTGLMWREVNEGVWLSVTAYFDSSDFLREKLFAGTDVSLGGFSWRIPFANPSSERCELPSRMVRLWDRVTGKRSRVREVSPEYSALAEKGLELAIRVQQSLLCADEDGSVKCDDDELIDVVSLALRSQYFLTEDELMAAGVFDLAEMEAVVWAIIDMEEVVAVVQSAIGVGDKDFFLDQNAG